MADDCFHILSEPSEGFYSEKRSKFLAFAFPIETKYEAMEQLRSLRNKYHDARHVCFAYTLGIDQIEERCNDDGEPSGTGGRPILGQIHSFGLHNTLLAVVRYYGGTPLGAANLGRAYQQAAQDALQQARITSRQLTATLRLAATYEDVDRVMRLAKKHNARVDYTAHRADGVDISVEVSRAQAESLHGELRQIHTLQWPDDHA